jgi:hypothetical protein
MSNNFDKHVLFREFMAQFEPMIQTAFDQGLESGFQRGFQAGRTLGFIEGVNALTPAVSDGLRHGSLECGKALHGLKNLGLHSDAEENE